MLVSSLCVIWPRLRRLNVFITQPVWEFLSPDFILTPSIFNSASFSHIQYWWQWLFHPYVRRTHPHFFNVHVVRKKEEIVVVPAVSMCVCETKSLWYAKQSGNHLLPDAVSWIHPWERAREIKSKQILEIEITTGKPSVLWLALHTIMLQSVSVVVVESQPCSLAPSGACYRNYTYEPLLSEIITKKHVQVS